jgi:hypothetical protein
LQQNLPRNTSSPALLPSISSATETSKDESLSPAAPASEEIVETQQNGGSTLLKDKVTRTVRRKKSDKLKLETAKVGPSPQTPDGPNSPPAAPQPPKMIKSKKKEPVVAPKDASGATLQKPAKQSQAAAPSSSPAPSVSPSADKTKAIAAKKRRSVKELTPPVVVSAAAQLPPPLPSFVSSQSGSSPNSPTSASAPASAPIPVPSGPKVGLDNLGSLLRFYYCKKAWI